MTHWFCTWLLDCAEQSAARDVPEISAAGFVLAIPLLVGLLMLLTPTRRNGR